MELHLPILYHAGVGDSITIANIIIYNEIPNFVLSEQRAKS